MKIEALSAAWRKSLSTKLPEIEYKDLGLKHFRDRADLTLENGKIGFYQKHDPHVFALKHCPLFTPPLQSWLSQVKALAWPKIKGSLRLRHGPTGKNGIWLDFANQDVKSLLDEKDFLTSLRTFAFVEIGQKRKSLGLKNDLLKLQDPELKPWTQTYVNDQVLPLFSCVGSFTQTGSQANQAIAQIVEAYHQVASVEKIIEFGSGIGTLTFPLAADGRTITACEFDQLACQGLLRTLNDHPLLAKRIKILQGNFQHKCQVDFSQFDSIAVNPPRSGLMDFLQPLQNIEKQKRPKYFFYMSCYLDSFIQDSMRIENLGYQIQNINILDQFAHTPHFEILSFWKLT